MREPTPPKSLSHHAMLMNVHVEESRNHGLRRSVDNRKTTGFMRLDCEYAMTFDDDVHIRNVLVLYPIPHPPSVDGVGRRGNFRNPRQTQFELHFAAVRVVEQIKTSILNVEETVFISPRRTGPRALGERLWLSNGATVGGDPLLPQMTSLYKGDAISFRRP